MKNLSNLQLKSDRELFPRMFEPGKTDFIDHDLREVYVSVSKHYYNDHAQEFVNLGEALPESPEDFVDFLLSENFGIEEWDEATSELKAGLFNAIDNELAPKINSHCCGFPQDSDIVLEDSFLPSDENANTDYLRDYYNIFTPLEDINSSPELYEDDSEPDDPYTDNYSYRIFKPIYKATDGELQSALDLYTKQKDETLAKWEQDKKDAKVRAVQLQQETKMQYKKNGLLNIALMAFCYFLSGLMLELFFQAQNRILVMLFLIATAASFIGIFVFAVKAVKQFIKKAPLKSIDVPKPEIPPFTGYEDIILAAEQNILKAHMLLRYMNLWYCYCETGRLDEGTDNWVEELAVAEDMINGCAELLKEIDY